MRVFNNIETTISVYSQPYDEKSSGSKTLSPNEGDGAEPTLRSSAPFLQKKVDWFFN